MSYQLPDPQLSSTSETTTTTTTSYQSTKRVDFLKPQGVTIPTPPLYNQEPHPSIPEQTHHHNHHQHTLKSDPPIPALKIPTIVAQDQAPTFYRPPQSTNAAYLPEQQRARSSSPRPSAEAIAMEKLWTTPKTSGFVTLPRTKPSSSSCSSARNQIPPPPQPKLEDSSKRSTTKSDFQPVQNNFYTQQQQQQQQQQQMYSAFTSTHQFQASQLSQQQYSQSMQYQPFRPSEPAPAPQPIQQPAPQPTFIPAPQPVAAAAPVYTPAPLPQTVPQPYKPAPAPVAKFTPAPAPAQAPVPVVHHSLASAPSAVPFLSGPSYNQTPQPFKPLPPPSITPSQQNFPEYQPQPTFAPAPIPQPIYAPPQPQPQQVYVPPPVECYAPAPEPMPQFTPAAPVAQYAPAPAPFIQPQQQPPTYFPEPFYQQEQQHNEFVHQQQLQQYHQQQVLMEEEVYKKKSVKETKQMFEQTIKQQSEGGFNDLKAPRMIMQQMVHSPTKPMTLPPDFGYTPAEIGLEPGPQPTMGYAPKSSNERKSSYYREKIEQSLFESMDKVPERVPAGGVKIIPPSPRKKSNTGQSDTAGMPPASFEQAPPQPTAVNTAAKSPFTATESECESDMDVNRKMNGVSGYLADTEEVQKTVSFSEQKIENFSSKSESVVVQSCEVVQQQQQQEQKFESIESKVEGAAATTVTDGVTAEVQQQSSEQVVTEEVTKESTVTEEGSAKNFLVNNDLPEDLQPVKVLPTEEPLPTLKKVPVPAAVQPEPQPQPEPVVLPEQQIPIVAPEPVPAPIVEPVFSAPVVPQQQNGYPSASDYESDLEKVTPTVWRPGQAAPSELTSYKPVHPVFNPPKPHETGPVAQPPSVFDPIDKIQPTPAAQIPQMVYSEVPKIEKPKPISYAQQQTTTQQSFQQQKSSSFQSYQQQSFVQQQQQQQHVSFPPVEPAPAALYYTSVTAQPVHNTIATETSNTLHMKETTESSNRVVNMQQTQRVVNLGPQQQQQNSAFMQKPGRFTPGEYRDSDYDSDGSRIRPMWTPHPSDSDEPHFRSVRPNFQQPRSTSLPRSYERIQTPMEFDTGPVLMPSKIDVSSVGLPAANESVEVLQTQTLDRKFTSKQTTTSSSSTVMSTQHMSNLRDDMAVKAHKVAPINFIQKASNQAESMSQSFKTKAYHFTNEVMTDMRKTPIKPILKNAFGHQVPVVPAPVQAAAAAPPAAVPASNGPQAYREESRVSQYDQSAATQGLNRSATSTPKHPQEPAIATKQPLFVAPLKDIAVVSGQPARFECIVACDATPTIRWTKNNVPIDEQSGQRYLPEYRNGVCRLSLPVAYESDAAKYCCVAENHLGHSQTCADLTVVDRDWRTASAVTEF